MGEARTIKNQKAFWRSVFLPQKRPLEGKKTLLFAAGIYVLLLIWAILFKFSAISEININSPMSLETRFWRGFRFFDFFLEKNAWRLIRGLLIAVLNILVFLPWGIYASFFYDKKRTILFAAAFSLMIECIQLFASFGVFSFEDLTLNTLGAYLGVLLFEKCVCRLSQANTQTINRWTVRIGGGVCILGYINVIVAMILYFSKT